MGRKIAIYADAGTSDFSVFSTRAYFSAYKPILCRAENVVSGRIFSDCGIFIMPGGADLLYCQKLNGGGNANIRRFVEDGGTYLGICAGAYYGCREIAYHIGRRDEICGARELAFIDACAYGSLPEIAGYYDETLKTAAWVNIITDAGTFKSFYHGGCAFDVADPAAQVIARFADLPGTPPAILEKKVGKGRVILSGVHFETDIYGLKDHKEKELADVLSAQLTEPTIGNWITEFLKI